MASPARFLVQLAEPRCQWEITNIVTQAGYMVVGAMEGQPPRWDILVTDQPLSRPEKPGGAERRTRGILALGPRADGDVRLPSDASRREIELACRLLVEIVRLRRKVRRSFGTHQTLRRLADQDPLTRLANRRCWERELRRRLAAARQSPVVLALFDIDHFKSVNDQLGHPTGDRVVAAVGETLRGSIRAGDLAGRLGGDEFGLLLVGVPPVEANHVVERVRQRAGEAATRAAGRPTSLSAGVAAVVAGYPDPLGAAADAALRRAKQLGRNQTVETEKV